MQRILLISDTHGKLNSVNELALRSKADFVIHAGDVGFYDEKSISRLSPRELRLLISHSPIWRQYEVDKQTDRKTLEKIVEKHKLLGCFPDYLLGDKSFAVPVYSVWGNHEDCRVIENIRKNNSVKNLYLLDADHFYEFKANGELDFALFGLGGNFLASKKLFDKPIGGRCGKIWATLHEFGALYKKVKHKSKPSIFVSHVSPGKEPLLTRLMIHFMPNIWISGHMGAPYTCVWNQFTIRELNEAMDHYEMEIDFIERYIQEGHATEEIIIAYELIKRPIPRKDFWFKRLWNINLPDVKDGYAVLIFDDGRFSLETFSQGINNL